jgi:hypothetical protein
LKIATLAAPQVSLAVGSSKLQALPHSTVFPAAQTTVGTVWSCTVTVWLQSAVLPQPSVARQVRVASKVFPQWPATLVVVLKMATVALPQVSLAPGASKSHELVHSTVLFATHEIAGAV